MLARRNHYKKLIKIYKERKLETDDVVEKERLSVYIKRMELRLENKLSEEIDLFFTNTIWLLNNMPYPDIIEWYDYHKQKNDFCKKYHIMY